MPVIGGHGLLAYLERFMDSLATLLSSASFLEKAILLGLGVALTGLLVPIVKSYMDRASFEKQKTFEAQIARQADVIRAQTQFLTDFSDHIWEYHKISQKVSYARLSGDREAYENALAVYRDALWDTLHKVRRAIGAARWFTSDAAHQALSSWYEDWFVRLEVRLRDLVEKDPDDAQWSEHHTRVHVEARERNYGLLHFLAKDFGLNSVAEETHKAMAAPSATRTAARGT